MDVDERKHKGIIDKQMEQMTKLGWRIIKLEEHSYGEEPVFRRAFLFFRNIMFAIKDPKKPKWNYLAQVDRIESEEIIKFN